MSSKRRSKRRAGVDVEEFEKLRREIRSSNSILTGLISFRSTAALPVLRRNAGRFAEHPGYRSHVWKSPFPRSFNEIRRHPFPVIFPLENELGWIEGLFSAFSARLGLFVQHRHRVDRSFLLGDFTTLSEELTSLEDSFGLSIWLADATQLFHQLHSGSRQKNQYIKDLLSASSVPPLVHLLISCLSYRSQINVSTTLFEQLFSGYEERDRPATLLLRLAIGGLPRVDPARAARLISATDGLPAVDRYQFFLLTIQALVSSGSMDAETAAVLRSMLQRMSLLISDPMLDRLLGCVDGPAPRISVPDPFASMQDAYQRGAFDDVLALADQLTRADITVEAVHLAIRASLAVDKRWGLRESVVDPKSPIAQIASDLTQVLSFAPDALDARVRLQKAILTNSGSAWAASLAMILARQLSDERMMPPTTAQSFYAMKCEVDQPELAFSLPSGGLNDNYLDRFGPGSGAAAARLILDDLRSPSAINESLPGLSSRHAQRITAFRSARGGDFTVAAKQFIESSKGASSQAYRLHAELLAAHCYLEAGDVRRAADSAASLIVESRYFGHILPVSTLVAKLLLHHDEPLAISETRGLLSTAIVFDTYSRLHSSRFDAQRADAFKDVLRRHGVARASELLAIAGEFSLPELIYFLRDVCVTDVLDQSPALRTSREVEDERVAIVLAVNELYAGLGQPPPTALKDELREIRTRQVARDTRLQLDRSKIYVNVDGIRRTVDVALQDLWNRYRQLVVQDPSAAALERIGEVLRAVMPDAERPLFIAVTEHSLERIRLFRQIFHRLIDEFALNKEFGLNANLSTNIRHGYVLRELRAPFLVSNLITNKDSIDGSYLPNGYWLERLPSDSQSGAARLNSLLASFSAEIDGQISSLNADVLRIRSDKCPAGLFNYVVDDSAVAALETRLSSIETYQEFIDELFSILWQLTDENLAQVRRFLEDSVLAGFFSALTSLEEELRASELLSLLPGLTGAIPLARQAIRPAFERVSSWFTLSGNNEYQDFDLEIAYEAGLQTVKTYYSNISISSTYVSPSRVVLKGYCLPIFARLFFILLDNSAQHGALRRDSLSISVQVDSHDTLILIRVSNDLPPDVDFAALSAKVKTINADYGQQRSADLVGEEGGSGYPKIWKLLTHDLAKPHLLEVALTDTQFSTSIIFHDAGLLA